jgi:hypothetical protein
MDATKDKVKVTLSIDAEALQTLLDYGGDRGQGEFVSRLILDYQRRRARAKQLRDRRHTSYRTRMTASPALRPPSVRRMA